MRCCPPNGRKHRFGNETELTKRRLRVRIGSRRPARGEDWRYAISQEEGTAVRDLVEIGMGRTARRAFGLDEVEIVPSRRTRSSKDVSTAWQIDAYRFDIPLVTHPTDAIVSPATAIAVGQLGGLGVLNAEGLWARHSNVDEALARLIDAAEHADWSEGEPSPLVPLLQELHGAPIRVDLITEAVKQVSAGGVTVAARVSPQRAAELTPHLLAAGVEILVLQGTIVSAEHVARDREPLNLKSFIAELDVPVIAGGVHDYRTAMHLMRTGAAGVIVGYGHSWDVTTTDSVLGIGVPMATAIVDAAAARRDYLDETGGRYVHVIADGGVQVSGDIAKSIACGADAVMLGAPLAMAVDAPGKGLYWTAAAAHPSLPRSRVDMVLFGTKVDLRTLLFGPSSDADGTANLYGALRRAMAKTGYSDLKEFQKVGLTVRS
jgi:IMP dehydrogenase